MTIQTALAARVQSTCYETRGTVDDGPDCIVAIARSGILAQEFCRRGAAAVIAAVFDRSLYLRAGGTFICIGGEADLGNGPLTLLIDRSASLRLSHLGLRAGQQGVVTPRRIAIGNAVAFTLDAARLWRPPRWPRADAPTTLRHTVAALARAARVAAPRDGLARPVFCPHEESTPLSRIGRSRITALERWLPTAFASARVPGAFRRAVHGLVGLGPGLTPSGDDFLIGMLAMLDALAQRKAHAALAHALAGAAPQSTSPLSRCFLAAAAAGHVDENQYRVVSSLLSGKVDTSIAVAGRVGHSSGWDMLAGAATALRVFAATRLGRANPAPVVARPPT